MGEREKIKNAHVQVVTLIERAGSGFKRLFAYLLPDGITCISCGCELGNNDNRRYSMCEKCLSLLPYRTGKYCKCCGQRIEEGVLCKNCEIATPIYDKVISPFEYSDFPRLMIIRQKEMRATYLFKHVAAFLEDTYEGFDITCDAVCYVPTYKPAVKRRGSDHTKRVAEIFAKELNLPICHCLERVRESGDQTEFTRLQRFENVRNSFALTAEKDKLPKGGKVVLIDDVMTTGATVTECTRLLKDYGVAEVYILALARR